MVAGKLAEYDDRLNAYLRLTSFPVDVKRDAASGACRGRSVSSRVDFSQKCPILVEFDFAVPCDGRLIPFQDIADLG